MQGCFTTSQHLAFILLLLSLYSVCHGLFPASIVWTQQPGHHVLQCDHLLLMELQHWYSSKDDDTGPSMVCSLHCPPLYLEADGEPVHHVQAGVALQVSSLPVILDLPHYDLHIVEVQGVLVVLSAARLIQKLPLCISNGLLSLVR